MKRNRGGSCHRAERCASLAVESIACGENDAYSQDGLEGGGDEIDEGLHVLHVRRQGIEWELLELFDLSIPALGAAPGPYIIYIAKRRRNGVVH